MNAFFDTSVLVAAFYGDHPHYQASRARFAPHDKTTGCCGAHSLAEIYSSLTRMPGNLRVSADHAVLYLGGVRERLSIISLDDSEYWHAVEEAARFRLSGGRIYDFLLVQCARKANAEIIYSWNVRLLRAVRRGSRCAGPYALTPLATPAGPPSSG